MKRMWEFYQSDKRIPVIISVYYDDESEEYSVEVSRGYDIVEISFEASHEPKDGLMNIQDVEQAVKLANKLLKDLKQVARRKKWVGL